MTRGNWVWKWVHVCVCVHARVCVHRKQTPRLPHFRGSERSPFIHYAVRAHQRPVLSAPDGGRRDAGGRASVLPTPHSGVLSGVTLRSLLGTEPLAPGPPVYGERTLLALSDREEPGLASGQCPPFPAVSPSTAVTVPTRLSLGEGQLCGAVAVRLDVPSGSGAESREQAGCPARAGPVLQHRPPLR